MFVLQLLLQKDLHTNLVVQMFIHIQSCLSNHSNPLGHSAHSILWLCTYACVLSKYGYSFVHFWSTCYACSFIAVYQSDHTCINPISQDTNSSAESSSAVVVGNSSVNLSKLLVESLLMFMSVVLLGTLCSVHGSSAYLQIQAYRVCLFVYQCIYCLCTCLCIRIIDILTVLCFLVSRLQLLFCFIVQLSTVIGFYILVYCMLYVEKLNLCCVC